MKRAITGYFILSEEDEDKKVQNVILEEEEDMEIQNVNKDTSRSDKNLIQREEFKETDTYLKYQPPRRSKSAQKW